MEMFTSSDVFQGTGDKLLGNIKGVIRYTNDILVLSKEILFKHIGLLSIIFRRLRTAGLKFSAPKFSFVLKDVT